jgi:hypothetical protein
MAEHGGLLGPMRVGSGKTLVTLLAAWVLEAQYPLLLVPGALEKRVYDDIAQLRRHWFVPENLAVLSYSKLSMAAYHDVLTEHIRPDLIIADEAHKVRNLGAACTKKLARYVDRAQPKFVAVSGTLLSRYTYVSHLGRYALDTGSPIHRGRDVERWDRALLPDVPWDQRLSMGALERFGSPTGYYNWVVNTPGVVAVSGPGCVASIIGRRWRPTIPAECARLIAHVEQTSTRPDGEPLDPAGKVMCLSMLSLGYWQCWDPLPPLDWLAARRTYMLWSDRHIDTYELDSADQVAQMYPDAPELLAWQRAQARYTPVDKVVWVDDAVLRQAVDWARRGRPGIVWVRWAAAGRRLEKLGLPYYVDALAAQRATGSIAASIGACGTGANLQHYDRNLVLTLPADADLIEQLVGRTHREGQRSHEISLDVNVAIDYQRQTLSRALSHAAALPGEKKLTLATWV